MTDLNSLMIFAKVVEANSFSEAARRLKMPTSTVSLSFAKMLACRRISNIQLWFRR
jgi:DNA-binding transcriptional LysR family regulator